MNISQAFVENLLDCLLNVLQINPKNTKNDYKKTYLLNPVQM